MPYVTQARIEVRIPAPLLIQALDDDSDGVADAAVLTELLQAASDAVDALVESQYSVPFATPPAMVKEAAFIFACEMIYDRRQVAERNPFKAAADDWRQRLALVGKGEVPLDTASGGGAAVVTNTSTVTQVTDLNSL